MTVPYCTVKLNRRGVGVELNPTYFRDGIAYVEAWLVKRPCRPCAISWRTSKRMCPGKRRSVAATMLIRYRRVGTMRPDAATT